MWKHAAIVIAVLLGAGALIWLLSWMTGLSPSWTALSLCLAFWVMALREMAASRITSETARE